MGYLEIQDCARADVHQKRHVGCYRSLMDGRFLFWSRLKRMLSCILYLEPFHCWTSQCVPLSRDCTPENGAEKKVDCRPANGHDPRPFYLLHS